MNKKHLWLSLLCILLIAILSGCQKEPCDNPPGIDETLSEVSFGKYLELKDGATVFSRSAYIFSTEKIDRDELAALTNEEFLQYLEKRATFTDKEWETIQTDLNVVRCGEESSSGICFSFCPKNANEYLESIEKIRQHPLVVDVNMVSTPSPAL